MQSRDSVLMSGSSCSDPFLFLGTFCEFVGTDVLVVSSFYISGTTFILVCCYLLEHWKHQRHLKSGINSSYFFDDQFKKINMFWCSYTISQTFHVFYHIPAHDWGLFWFLKCILIQLNSAYYFGSCFSARWYKNINVFSHSLLYIGFIFVHLN